MKLKGFTLAEVLITLLIIGVVAALTIPSVITKAEQMEFKTGLKKAVSVLNEAIQVNIAVEGETPYESDNLFDYLKRHMNIVAANSGPSMPDGIERGKYNDNWHFYTTDGMRFEFSLSESNYQNTYLYESGVDIHREAKCATWKEGWGSYPPYSSFLCYCGSYGLTHNPNNTKNTPCIITVDVNGDRKPNPKEPTVVDIYGNGNKTFIYHSYPAYTYPNPEDKKLQDVFNILITEDRAIPYGVVAQRAMYSK